MEISEKKELPAMPDFKSITLEGMIDFIKKNAPQDKEWFQKEAVNSDGVYNHIHAKTEFFNRYYPGYADKKTKADILKEW